MEPTRFESLYPADSREKEIGQILTFIKSGLSCQLIGLPGVGRSNLMALLAFNRQVRIHHLGEEGQKKFHFLFLNLAEVGGGNLFELNKFIFINLWESLEERQNQAAIEKIRTLFKEALSFGEPLLLWQNLKKAIDLLVNQEGLSLVFLFNRFEDYQKNATAEFFLNLRSLRSLAKYRFAAVFSLVRPLEKTLDPSIYQEFYESVVGHHIYLPLYDPPEMEFRLSHLAQTAGKNLKSQTKEQILTLTGGHGKLTRVCVETLFSQEARHLQDLEDFFLHQAPIRGVLEEIWRALTPQEQSLVPKIVRQPSVGENEDLDFLVRQSLTIPLLTHYLQTKPAPSGEKIYFRSETNEILKGETIISDGLTAQEFRLLKFLLENPGKVCEREEIIKAVWPEAKSAAGISDEAIDQMVFRLRRKTEKDPGRPQYLQTVKGRGFRFIP